MENIIKFYTEQYPTESYSSIANRILDNHPEIEISHRTLRRKLSEYERELEVENIDCDCETICEPCLDTVNKELASSDMFDFSLDNVDPTKNWLVMGCLHFPFHNKPFFNALLALAKDLKDNGELTGLILAGDNQDMHSISRHAKGKITIPGLTLSEEYRLSNLEYDKIDQAVGNTEKHYFYGNHEMWYSEYMSGVDASKLGTGVVKSPLEALRLRERGYKVQTDYKKARLLVGDMNVIHGTYVTLHASHKHLQEMKRNVMFVHTHRLGRYDESEYEAINIGWVGDKEQKVFGYMDDIQKEKWKNGAAIIHVDQDGKSHVTQITWKNGRFYYGGKEYK